MSLVSDIVDYLVTENVADEAGVDIFDNYLPDTDELPAISVMDTGGQAPDIYLPIHNPTFQVFIRSSTYATGEALLNQVRETLHGVLNTTIGSTNFEFIHALSHGGFIGGSLGNEGETRGLYEFSINFICKVRNV